MVEEDSHLPHALTRVYVCPYTRLLYTTHDILTRAEAAYQGATGNHFQLCRPYRLSGKPHCLCRLSLTTTTAGVQITELGCVPIKLYLHQQVAGQFGQSLQTSRLGLPLCSFLGGPSFRNGVGAVEATGIIHPHFFLDRSKIPLAFEAVSFALHRRKIKIYPPARISLSIL